MQISFAALEMPVSGAVALLVEKDKPLAGLAAEADSKTGGALSKAMSASRFDGSAGQTLDIVAPNGLSVDRILLVGLGTAADKNTQDWTEVGAAVVAALLGSGSAAVTVLAEAGADAVAMAEGALLRSYRFDKYRTKEPESKKPTLKAVTFATDSKDAEKAFAPRKAVVDGVFFTRDLVSEPANILHPESFADRIGELKDLGVEVEVLGEKEMAELGMGSLLGVGQGSIRESKLAIMVWNGGNKGDAPISFVGKGVTFDTGGISLKPGEGMEQMKWDMGGAGTVVGLMKALAGRKAKVNVVAVVGLVENMPDGNAQRPGDVVTSMSGQTIEILNTDAEGRLVLADALWYTQDRFKPKTMIDLATLTGAIIITLGHEHAGIFTDNEEIATQLSKAGLDTGDKVWRLPLHKNYDKMIDCPTADMKNIGGRAAGSITAAQFLRRFTNDVPWCHIDIAGTVWSEKDLPLSEKGGTGYGVRLLDRFVADNYEG
ncbi:leucyl aminopeptidase [Kordiimonas gwangyangensis]|uniref:leucyl aminopeptidase n=1 Tax=Kordiimonas gwangyangensis TaxID=288022 RepID=UPI00037FEDB3|nr:leucyl aminopeptidase [Kordiimonas gwangyangensis]